MIPPLGIAALGIKFKHDTIHNSQVMETAKMPHHWRMD
jgi:hypothetical protein